jgi:hypothetical protein
MKSGPRRRAAVRRKRKTATSVPRLPKHILSLSGSEKKDRGHHTVFSCVEAGERIFIEHEGFPRFLSDFFGPKLYIADKALKVNAFFALRREGGGGLSE